MEKLSFREILQRKIGKNHVEKTKAETAQNPFQQRILESSDLSVFFQIPRPNTLPQGRYPRSPTPPPKPTREATPNIFTLQEKNADKKLAKEPVSRVKRSELGEIPQTKWARFEKMVGQNLGESTSPEDVSRHFRRFIKKVHPDSADQNSTAKSTPYDFATLVKIKDELLSEVRKALETKRGKDVA